MNELRVPLLEVTGPKMRGTAPSESAENQRIILGLLESVERDGARSQRHIASELGIALGLVNAYLKRCVKKGLVKVSEAPARRYAYYLTPRGFAEKSRLTVEYLTSSFEFFRHAKSGCMSLLNSARANGLSRVVLAGRSDVAEIAALCAREADVEIVAVVDPNAEEGRFFGFPLVATFEGVGRDFDAVVLTNMAGTVQFREELEARFGADRVLVPDLLISRFRRAETFQ